MALREIWECLSCNWEGYLPRSANPRKFRCPKCKSFNTGFVSLQDTEAGTIYRGVG